MTQRLGTLGACAAIALALIATTPGRLGAQAAAPKKPLGVRSAATSAGVAAGGLIQRRAPSRVPPTWPADRVCRAG